MSLANKLTEERRGRLAAERMLELREAELRAANRKLGLHARQLTEKIVKTRAVVETIRDENQRFRSDLTAANLKIAVTERRLWHSIETINDGFAFFNADNEMIMANNSYLNTFDGLEEIRPGVNFVTILQVLTEEGIVNTGALCPESWREMMTNRLYTPEPEPVVIQLWNGQYIKMIDRRGAEGDMVSLGLNITASVQHEKSLSEARAIAESANRAKSAFLANMSHEIRTPMNGVVGMADVLAETELSDEQHLYVETIKNSGEALLLIINDVLDYSKIEAGKLDLNPTAFDLEQAVREVLLLLHPSARGKGVALLMEFDVRLPTAVIGDPGRIRQVLTNLIGNAVKFTASGHVIVRVCAGMAPDDPPGTIDIQIEDSGIGIPDDQLTDIFEEFNQVENERNRQFDGTGLGLAISQRLVRMMGSSIAVDSAEGVGSTFAFRLVMQSPPDAAALPSIPADLAHVLILDPQEVSSVVFQRQMERLGIKGTRCSSIDDMIAQSGDTVTAIFATHTPLHHDSAAIVQALANLEGAPPLVLLSNEPGTVNSDIPVDGVHTILTRPISRHDLLSVLAALPTCAPATALRPMRILAAEDNRTNRLVFSKMIKKLDVDLTFAENGEEAVSLYETVKPDIIFMDISMPRMDGKEATQAIRALEAQTGAHVPIIALTAHAMAGDEDPILAAGLDHCLNKPLRKPDIMEQICAVHTPQMRPLEPEALPEQPDLPNQLVG